MEMPLTRPRLTMPRKVSVTPMLAFWKIRLSETKRSCLLRDPTFLALTNALCCRS